VLGHEDPADARQQGVEGVVFQPAPDLDSRDSFAGLQQRLRVEPSHDHAYSVRQPAAARVVEEPGEGGAANLRSHRPHQEEQSPLDGRPRALGSHSLETLLDLAHRHVGVEVPGKAQSAHEAGFHARDVQPLIAPGEDLELVREIEDLRPHGPSASKAVAHVERFEVLDASHGGDGVAGVDGQERGKGGVLDDRDRGAAANAVQQRLVVGVERGQRIQLARELRPRDELEGILEIGRHGSS